MHRTRTRTRTHTHTHTHSVRGWEPSESRRHASASVGSDHMSHHKITSHLKHRCGRDSCTFLVSPKRGTTSDQRTVSQYRPAFDLSKLLVIAETRGRRCAIVAEECSSSWSPELSDGFNMEARPHFSREEINNTVWEVPVKFTRLKQIGSGAYGSVWWVSTVDLIYGAMHL